MTTSNSSSTNSSWCYVCLGNGVKTMFIINLLDVWAHKNSSTSPCLGYNFCIFVATISPLEFRTVFDSMVVFVLLFISVHFWNIIVLKTKFQSANGNNFVHRTLITLLSYFRHKWLLRLLNEYSRYSCYGYIYWLIVLSQNRLIRHNELVPFLPQRWLLQQL